MKTRSDADTLIVPPALVKEVQAAAEEEHRQADEVLREAVERYLRERVGKKSSLTASDGHESWV